ncbi:MAG: P-loop NTPase [Phycisphaerales bacterium]
MNTQADRLRERMRSVGAHAAGAGAGAPGAAQSTAAFPAAPVRMARTVAVGSGKGGVGKSTVALAVAWAAAERGVKTALVDADLGLANLDILCGVQPVRTAADWLAGRAQLAACFTQIAPRLWLLPGASGVARMADLELPQRHRLVEGLARVASHVELMVVDLGAGLGAGTLDVAVAADRLLVVATPEPTALADAYGLLKACARRGRTERVALAVNMADSADAAARAAQRISSTAARFLGMQVPCAGWMPRDNAVLAAVAARRPLLLHAPDAPVSRALRRLEGHLHAPALAGPASTEPAGFLGRLAAAFGLSGTLKGGMAPGAWQPASAR